MSNIIKLKRGSSTNLQTTTLQQGEPAITTDSNELFIGTSDGSKSVFFPITTNEVSDDSTATITLSNNKDIRIPTTPNNSGLTSLTLSFNEDTFTSSSRFNCKVSFKTSSTGCGFTITPPTDVTIKYSGDDVTDSVFTPVAGYGYDLTFYWNGFYMTCLVSGTSLFAYDLTITYGASTDRYDPIMYISSGTSDITGSELITTMEHLTTKTIPLITNKVYLCGDMTETSGWYLSNNVNCNNERGDAWPDEQTGGYFVHEITITGQPASLAIETGSEPI